MPFSTSTTGKSKHRVSAMICFKVSAGISSPTNCLIASKAISSLLRFSIVSKKVLSKGVIVSGKYNPLSVANP
ncbi:hypothetical protein D3C84_622040 [compost metagenome]